MAVVRRVSAPSEPIVVIGAGASTLLTVLLAEGWQHMVAVDLSAAALGQLRERLSGADDRVTYIHSDVRDLQLAEPVAVWHDRATFHFLTDLADQQRYAERAAAAVRPGGHLVLANFAPGGPDRCSGLLVARHDLDSLRALFHEHFELVESFEADHVTPWGSPQRFLHALWQRRAA